MTKPHTTLRPSTNIILIIIWASFAIFSISRFDSPPLAVIIISVIFGALGGTMQVLSMKEGCKGFLNSNSILEVRAQLKKTKWGKRYIYYLWSISVVILMFAIFAGNPLWAWLAGYFTMLFVRDVVTLKSTFELAKLNIPGRRN